MSQSLWIVPLGYLQAHEAVDEALGRLHPDRQPMVAGPGVNAEQSATARCAYEARWQDTARRRLRDAVENRQLRVFVIDQDDKIFRLTPEVAAPRVGELIFESPGPEFRHLDGSPILLDEREFKAWLQGEVDRQADERRANRDAFEHAYWPAIMCLAWISTRDQDFTGLARLDETDLRLAIRLAIRSAEKPGPEGRCVEWNIKRELLAAIQSGRLEGTGSLGANRVPIDAAVACLPDARFGEDKWDRMTLETGDATYHDLLFPREAALALWPPLSPLHEDGPPDQTIKAVGRIAGRYSHRPPTQRQQAVDALRTLYGTKELPPMKWAARLAEVNGYLVQMGAAEISIDTLRRAVEALQAEG